MNDTPLKYESREGIAIITLNRPEALNAMNEDMVQGLRQAWQRFNDSDDRCAVVHGAGERAFCAGLDMRSNPKEYWRCVPGIGIEVSKPIVTAVFGHCIGSGYVLTQMSDLCVASETAQFSYPEAQIGYSGGMIVGVMGRVPHKIAMEFMLVGRAFLRRTRLSDRHGQPRGGMRTGTGRSVALRADPREQRAARGARAEGVCLGDDSDERAGEGRHRAHSAGRDRSQ